MIGVTAVVVVEIAASDTFGENVEEAASKRTSDENLFGEEVVVNGSDI